MAPSLLPARVDVVLADAPPEEALAAIAAGRAVVFPGGFVCADGAERRGGLGLPGCGYRGRLGPQPLCDVKYIYSCASVLSHPVPLCLRVMRKDQEPSLL